MKRSITVFLLLCMFASLFSGMAFAVDDTQDAAAEAPAETAAEKECDIKTVFNAIMFVAANEDAALDGTVSVKLDTLGSTGTLYLPGKADASKLCFSWDDTGITVSRDGTVFESGTAPVAPADGSITYKISKGHAFAYLTIKTVQGSASIEPMFLDLDESLGTIAAMNADKDHETWCYGQVQFDGSALYIGIKGRGNSTWGFDKKPYNLTVFKNNAFEKKVKAELIQGVNSKKWSLVANHLDSSLLRNKIAMDLANALGIGLSSRFVDLWMNGEYLGSYLMTPKNDYQAPDGGYALENDNYLETEDPQFQIPGMYEIGAAIKDDGYYNRITVKDIGDDAVDAGVDASQIEAWFDEAWASLLQYDSEDYQNYFDLDSWAKMFLMYEVSKTYDCYAGSLLMHRDGLTENDKLIAGPAWDYDVSFGRTLHKFLVGVTIPTQMTAEGWYNDSIGLVAVDKPISLLQELGKHASFMQHVAKVYSENKAVFEDIAANVTRQQTLLRDSALMNNDLWNTHHLGAEYVVAPNTMHLIGTGKYALNYHVTLNWDEYVYNLREYCEKRVLWLTDHLYSETPAGEIARTTSGDGELLTVTLTAGDNNASYQWQRLENGTWTNISEATKAQFALSAADKSEYRCIVSNAGPVICTTHGGKVPTAAQAILNAPVKASGETPVAPAPSSDAEKPANANFFTDVDRSLQGWYANAVDWAVRKNITKGISETLFAPEQVCTRGQVVTFLWRAAGQPAAKNTANPFKDVQQGEYYYDAVLWAVENGITAGTSDDTFEPDAPCTRAQVVTFLWRAAGKPGTSGNANPFRDVPGGSWFTDAVLWANANKITSGTSAEAFDPDASCTRAHIVTFLFRSAAGN